MVTLNLCHNFISTDAPSKVVAKVDKTNVEITWTAPAGLKNIPTMTTSQAIEYVIERWDVKCREWIQVNKEKVNIIVNFDYSS